MSLKSFFSKIGKFFSKLWSGLLPEMKKAVHVGVTITDAIKKYDEEHPGFVDLISKIIPGEWDDNLKDKIRTSLPDVMIQLRLVDATLNLTDPDEIVAAAIDTLKKLGGVYRSAALNDLAIIIAQVASDGKLDWNDAVYLMKWYYDHKEGIESPAMAA